MFQGIPCKLFYSHQQLLKYLPYLAISPVDVVDIPVFIGLYTSQLVFSPDFWTINTSTSRHVPARRVRLSPTWPQTNELETAGALRSWRRNISRDPLHLHRRREIGWCISILSDSLKRVFLSLESEAKKVDLHRNCLQMMGFVVLIVYQQALFQVVGAVNFQFNTRHSCVWSHEVMSLSIQTTPC